MGKDFVRVSEIRGRGETPHYCGRDNARQTLELNEENFRPQRTESITMADISPATRRGAGVVENNVLCLRT